MKRAIVIGAGFGGLALAIRLQAAGVATTIVEARDKPGGRAYHWVRDGFTFDAGPTVITDPDCLSALWTLTGHDIAWRRVYSVALVFASNYRCLKVLSRLAGRARSRTSQVKGKTGADGSPPSACRRSALLA